MHVVGDAVGEEARYEGLDVRLLMEDDRAIRLALDLYVEEVGHVPFVFCFPSFEELVAEDAKGRSRVVGCVEDHDVVDVAAQDDAIGWVVAVSDEEARISLAAGEALFEEPGEKAALEAAAALNEAVEGLVEDPGEAIAVFVVGWLARRGVGVDGFSFLELALKVGGCKIPPAYEKLIAGSQCRQKAQGRGTHGARPGLVEVDAGDLSAALYAQSSLECAISLHFEDP